MVPPCAPLLLKSHARPAGWLRRDEPGCADEKCWATAADMRGCGPPAPDLESNRRKSWPRQRPTYDGISRHVRLRSTSAGREPTVASHYGRVSGRTCNG